MQGGLQSWIHNFEEGAGVRHLRRATACFAFLVLALFYNLHQFQNFSHPEAMDAAQLARNIADGRGYTTDFIRPLSLYLLQKKGGETAVRAGGHPDISNAPLYPILIAASMKVLPFRYEIAAADEFERHQPETRIAWVNQLFFFVGLCLVFALARNLFDSAVAWVSVIVLGGTDLLWRYTLSGLPVMLLTMLVLMLAGWLVWMEQGGRTRNWGIGRLVGFAVVAGILAGLCGLTRYACAALILSVLAFIVISFDQRRGLLCLAACLGFVLVMSPWLARNYSLSGTLFGTALHSLYEDTDRFPAQTIQRTLNPENPDTPADVNKVSLGEHGKKLRSHFQKLYRQGLPALGGSWIIAFFLASLLVPFQNPSIKRLRVFLLCALAVLIIAQAMSAGPPADSTRPIHTDANDLLVALAPLACLFGAALFFLLLDQWQFEVPSSRHFAAAMFCAILCLPLILTLFSRRQPPVAWPPYHPPVIHEAAGWMQPGEVVMSDIPWAVAWYGRRASVWLTREVEPDFFDLRGQLPVNAILLTPVTLDSRLVSGMLQDPEPWGRFALQSVLQREVPDDFPLTHAFADWFPQILFLADRQRW